MIDAAAAVFADMGYHGASTKLIADRVGIKQGSLYYYFASKEAALEEVCAKGVGDFIVGLLDILKDEMTVEDRMRAVVANHLRPIEEQGDYVKTFNTQRQYLPEASRKKVGRQTREYEKLILKIFEDGIADGAFDPALDCELAMLGLVSELNGVFGWYRKRAPGRTLQEIGDEIAERFIAQATQHA